MPLQASAQDLKTSTLQFTPSYILLTLFFGILTALIGFLAAYAKSKGERRAAREHVEETIREQAQAAAAIELEKAKVGAQALHEADRRKCIFALATVSQSFLHSMCWCAWTFRRRPSLRHKATERYDEEAHQLTPQVMGQLALLQLLDQTFHDLASPLMQEIFALDVEFGEAIVTSETDADKAVQMFDRLNDDSYILLDRVSRLFGGHIRFQDTVRT
jgi:hypothetical protein